MKSRINLSKLLLVSGFSLLVAVKGLGQTPNISFNETVDDNSESITICGEIGGGGQNDIDIRPSFAGTYQWEWSSVSNSGPWNIDPYTGQEFVISSFSSTPGTFWFRLRVINAANPGGIYSDVIVLTVSGSAPTSPTGVGASRCDTGPLTLTASGCSTYRWYNAPFAGTLLGSNSSFTTPSISSTTIYYVSCRNGTCESPRTPVVATIGTPGTPSAISGPATVCPGQNNVTYSVTNVTGVTYTWSYSGSGASYSSTTNSVTISFSGGATAGTLSVTATGSCGTSSASNLGITVSIIPTPIVGTITQPTCAVATGSIAFSGLPATGTWTLTRLPGGVTSTGTGTSTTLTNIPTGIYTYTVTNAGGCISNSTANITINPAPGAPSPPTVGTITQPTCPIPTGSVVLSGLPTPLTWTLTRSPGGVTSTGTGASTTLSGIPAGTYTYTVTYAGCISGPSTSVVITPAPGAPPAPTVGTITQPNCAVGTGSVILNGLPATGTWTLTRSPGAVTSTGTGISTTISLLATGTYTYTVTNDVGCISGSSANIVINAPAGPPAPIVGTRTQPTCTVPTGSVDLSGLPATGTWTLTRSPGGTNTTGTGTTTTVTGIPPGATYTYTVTDASGCISVASGNVVINAVPSNPPAPVIGLITNPTCTVPTGRVILNSLPAGTWTINPGGLTGSTSSTTILGLAAPGIYTFTVTDAAGCTSVPSANVNIGAQPVTPTAPIIGTITQPTCALATGSVVLNGLPSGSWVLIRTPGGTVTAGNTASRTLSLLPAGVTYTYTVTNSAGCTSVASASVAIDAQPTIPSTPTASVTVQPTCAIPTGTIVVSAPLGAQYEYSLDLGTYQISPTFTLVAVGNHTITARLAASPLCISLPSSTLSVDAVPAVPTTPTASVTVQPSCTLATGTVVVSAPLGAQYEYSLDLGAYQVSPTFTLVAAGNHTVTARLIASPTCVSPASPTLTVDAVPAVPATPAASVTVQPTCAIPTGTIVVSAPLGAQYEYAIDLGTYQVSPTFTLVPVGNHTVTARLIASPTCVSPASPTLTVDAVPAVPATPAASVTVQPTCAIPTGTIVVSAPLGAQYEYAIDLGTYQVSPTFTLVAVGNHTVTARLIASPTCVSPASPTLTVDAVPAVPATPAASVTVQPTCAIPTGTIVVSAPLGAQYEYAIDLGTYQVSPTFTLVAVGNHTVTARLIASPTCVSPASSSLTVNAVPAVPATPAASVTVQPTCAIPTGTIVVSAPLGAQYEYSLDLGTYQVSPTFTLVPVGNHTVTARLIASPTCVSPASSSLTVNAVPAVPATPAASVTVQPTCAIPTGTIVVSAPLGAQYEYALDLGTYQVSPTFTLVAAGNHTVTARLIASPTCVSPASSSLTVNAVPAVPATPAASVTVQPTCAIPTGTIVVSAPLGAQYEYAIDLGTYQVSPTFTLVPVGNHTVTARLIASPTCVSPASSSLTVNAVPAVPATPAASVTVQPTCAIPTGTIVVSAPLGAQYEYAIDLGTYQVSPTFTLVAVGNHTVTARLIASPTCVSPASSSLTVNAVPAVPATPAASVTVQPTCAIPTGTIVVSAPLGAQYEYAIDLGTYQVSPTFTLVPVGNHTVTARLIASPTCVSLTSSSLTVIVAPGAPSTPSSSVTVQPTCAIPTGTIVVSAPLGAQYEYAIDLGTYQVSPTFTLVPVGNHTVTARLIASPTCVSPASSSLTVDAVPAVPATPAASVTVQPTCAIPTGTIVVSAPLGAQYEYAIDLGTYQVSPTFTLVAVGNHTVTARLIASPTCVSPASPTLTVDAVPAVPATPAASVTVQPTCAIPTGTIVVSAPLGAQYEYAIDLGTYQVSPTFTLVPVGNHTVTARLIASPTCVSPASSSLTVDAVPAVPATPAASVTIQPTCAIPTGTLVISAPLGAQYEYALDLGTYQVSPTFTLVAVGNHTVTARLIASPTCVSPASSSLTVNAVPAVPATPAASVTIQPTCAVPTGTIVVSAPLGAQYEYTLDLGTFQVSPTFTLVAVGNHTVTARLIASPTCVSPASSSLTVNAVPAVPATPAASVTVQPTCAIPTGTIVVSSPLGAQYEYSLDLGTYQVSPTFTLVPVGNHTVTARLIASPTCVSPASSSLTVDAVPAVPATPAASVTIQPTCAVPTGTIVVSAPLGVQYEYTLDLGTYQVSPTFTLVAVGNHTVTARLIASPTCVSPASSSLTVDAAPTVPAIPTASVTAQPTCSVLTGTIDVSAPLGAQYEYALDLGVYQVSPTFTLVPVGNHTVTARLIASPTCVSPASSTLTVDAVPAVPAIPAASVTVQPTCAIPTGTIVVSAPLGAQYEYSLDLGTFQVSPTFTLVAVGNHTVTARLIASPTCVSPASSSLTVDAVPAVPATPAASVTVQPTCTIPTGTIVVSAPLGAQYEYSLDLGTYQVSPTFTLVPVGNHTVTSRLIASPTCVSPASSSLTVNAAPTVPAIPTASVTAQTTCSVLTGTIDVSSPLGAQYEYALDLGVYQVSPTFTLVPVGTHTVTARLIASPTCVSPASSSLTVNAAPTVPAIPTASVTAQPTCSVLTGTIDVSAPLGAQYEYALDLGTYQVSPTFTLVAVGNHTVTARLIASPTCVSPASPTLTVDAVPAVPATPAAGVTVQPTCAIPTGTIEVSAPLGAQYEYSIDLGTYQVSPTFTLVAVGNHTVTARLIASPTCVSPASSSLTVNAAPIVPAIPTASVTAQPTCSVLTGTIDVSTPLGAQYEYSLDLGVYQASPTFTLVPVGNHTVTARLIASPTCVSPASSSLTVNAAPTVPAIPTASVTAQTTCSVLTGTIDVSAPLGAQYEYALDLGTYQVSPTFTLVAVGNHTVTARLIASPTCVSPASSSLTVNAVPAVPATPAASVTVQPTCAIPTGTIEVSAPLGAQYEYALDLGTYQVSPTFTLVPVGNHTVTARLIASPTCVSPASSSLTVNAAPTIPSAPTVGSITHPTCSDATGSVVLNGLPAGNWTINPGAITGSGASVSISGLAAGTYNYTVTNDATCTSGLSADIVINPQPATPAAPVNGGITQPTCTVPTGSVILNGLPGTGSWTIDPGSITGTGTSITIPGLDPGTYNFRVTNDEGCTSPATGDVVIDPVPAAPAAPSVGTISQPTCLSSTGSVVLNGLPSGNWTINPGAIAGSGASATISGLQSGNL